MERDCEYHGLTSFVKRSDGGWRCKICRREAVQKRRRRVKEILVEEHGGKCIQCGYSKCIRALHFHHRDPTKKGFGIAAKGWTHSLERLREETSQCDLLCANCHAEIESSHRW